MAASWEQQRPVKKFIGFDATEDHRTKGGGTYDVSGDSRYHITYLLREWGFDRDRCKQVIASAGLPIPSKSACFFCPASKQHEIVALDSRLLNASLRMEANYREGKHFRGDDYWTVKATHRLTGEKREFVVEAANADDARSAFRLSVGDVAPYRWKLRPSRAVPGLGRSFTWASVVGGSDPDYGVLNSTQQLLF